MSTFTLFDTPIGRCGIAWEGDVIVGVRLPEARFDDAQSGDAARLGAAGDR